LNSSDGGWWKADDDGAGIEQILDLAQYLDTINKTNPAQGLSLEIENLVENEQKEDALKKVVEASSALSSAPERGS
jgi:translation initiation factor 3 subunit M